MELISIMDYLHHQITASYVTRTPERVRLRCSWAPCVSAPSPRSTNQPACSFLSPHRPHLLAVIPPAQEMKRWARPAWSAPAMILTSSVMYKSLWEACLISCWGEEMQEVHFAANNQTKYDPKMIRREHVVCFTVLGLLRPQLDWRWSTFTANMTCCTESVFHSLVFGTTSVCSAD